MKKFLPVLFLLIFFNSSLAQSDNYEFRSIWVVTWEYISGGSSVAVNKERIRTILDNMKAANMTSVLWQVRQAGTSYYQSSYEPWGAYAGSQYPGFDPLQYAIEEAHKRGLELHAWFNVFASGSTAPGTPAYEHPEWICRDRDGIPMSANIALSPGLPAVRAYLNNVAMEVIRNYDIDGFHLDYVRWNEYTNTSSLGKSAGEAAHDGMISPEVLEEMRGNAAGRYLYDVEHPYSGGVPSGFSSWEEWWRWSVTEFVKDLQDSIKSEKEWVKLSVAALGRYNWDFWNGYNEVYQDAALWFNQGYIDQIAGMHYHWTTPSGFLSMLVSGCPSCWGQFIQPGIAAGRIFTVGPPSYILQDQNVWHNHPGIVNAIRTVDWVDGFQFFSYASWRNKNYFNEAGDTFLKRKTKQRNALASSQVVPSPQLQINKIDSLKYRLTVTPASVTEPYWFILYRSETNNFSRDTSHIVEIAFSDSVFSFEETFDGLQDYNGTYKYRVTMLNRFWKESELSNTVTTDPIPSLAPVVVSTIPVQGGTMLVTSPIVINFSKAMNLQNIQNYFSFSPPASISSITAEPKKVVIQADGLQYSTAYVLRVDSLLRDINGRMLDGNNDGIEGDPFYLSFETADADTIGPVLVAMFPQAGDSIDVHDVLRITFNEPLDSASVNSANIILYRNGVAVPSEAMRHNYAGGSVVSVKPPLMAQNENYSLLIKKDVSDIYGNKMAVDVNLSFRTKAEGYGTLKVLDNFSQAGPWSPPNYSGSTTGIIIPNTYWEYNKAVYLPSTSPKQSAELGYEWDPDAVERLIREYLSGGAPRLVEFDTTYTLQVYINGDGSGTLFRFAVDEDNSSGTWPYHEVSKWIPIDWRGWKLVEWKLSDPDMVGTWIGNEILDGTRYRLDSFQFTDADGSAMSGVLNFDNLRVVLRTFDITSAEEEIVSPMEFRLYQNYPNPFNPSTVISFDLNTSGKVTLEVFDILGRKIKTLLSEEMTAGHHRIHFNASDLSSGQYIYRIITGEQQISKMMILLK